MGNFNRGDICYYLHNNRVLKEAKVVSRQEGICVIQVVGSCGAINMPEDCLYRSREEALEHIAM